MAQTLEQQRAWTRANKERRNAERRAKYRADVAYAVKAKLRALEYRNTHAEKLRQQRPEKSRRYRENNPEKLKVARREYWKARPGLKLHYVRLRQAQVLRATPAWADKTRMKSIYSWATELGMEVDHVVPLKSRLVCGLHCEANLEPSTATNNARKGNRWWPDMP